MELINFVPNKLYAVRNSIRKQHKYMRKNGQVSEMSKEESEDFIIKIMNMTNAQFESYIYYINARQVYAVIRYMISNNVYKNERLLKIIEFHADLLLVEYLILRFENQYHNKEILVLFELFKDNKELEEKFQRKYIISLEKVLKILSEEEPESIIIQFINRQKFKINSINKFGECLNKMAIIKDTNLYEVCKKYFYAICSKEFLLNNTEEQILQVFYKMDAKLKKEFLKNILYKMNNQELFGWRQLAQQYRDIVGEIESSFFNQYIEEFRESEQRKFVVWMKQQSIFDFFNEKNEIERARFWIKLADKFEIEINRRRKMLILDDKKYKILEFCSGGAIYIYEREYYMQNVNSKVRSEYSDTSLKQDLNNRTKYIKRIEHRGSWTTSVIMELDSLGVI